MEYGAVRKPAGTPTRPVKRGGGSLPSPHISATTDPVPHAQPGIRPELFFSWCSRRARLPMLVRLSGEGPRSHQSPGARRTLSITLPAPDRHLPCTLAALCLGSEGPATGCMSSPGVPNSATAPHPPVSQSASRGRLSFHYSRSPKMKDSTSTAGPPSALLGPPHPPSLGLPAVPSCLSSQTAHTAHSASGSISAC